MEVLIFSILKTATIIFCSCEHQLQTLQLYKNKLVPDIVYLTG